MRTAAFSAQDALYAAIDAATYPGEVTRSLGVPARLEHDLVWVAGRIDDIANEYRVSGLGAVDERFTLNVHVFSRRRGTLADVRDRAVELADAVDDALTADPTLGGTVMLATVVRRTAEESIDEDGRARGFLISLYVECSAYLTA